MSSASVTVSPDCQHSWAETLADGCSSMPPGVSGRYFQEGAILPVGKACPDRTQAAPAHRLGTGDSTNGKEKSSPRRRSLPLPPGFAKGELHFAMSFRQDRLDLGSQMNLSVLPLFALGICHGDEDRVQTSPIMLCACL